MRRRKKRDKNFPIQISWINPEDGHIFDMPYFSMKELLLEIQAYRKNNNYPEVPYLADVVEDFNCRALDPTSFTQLTEEVPVGDIDRSISQYFAGARAISKMLWGGEDVYVDSTTAERRSEKCLKCPYHIEPHQLADGIPKDSLLDRALDGAENKYAKELGVCKICTCYLKYKTQCTRKVINESLSTKDKLRLNQLLILGRDGQKFKCWQVEEGDE